MKKYNKSFTFIRDIIRDYRVWLFVILAETLVGTFFSLLLPYLAKIETDQLVSQKEVWLFFEASPLSIFFYIIAIIVLFQSLEKIITTGLNHIKQQYREQFADNLFIKMYKRLRHVELGIYANKRNQDLFDKILSEKYFVGFLLQTIMSYINIIIFMIGSIGLLAGIDSKIGIALVLGAIAYYIFYYIDKEIDIYGRFQTRELERSLREVERIARSEYHKLVYAGGGKLIENTIYQFNTERRNIIQSNNKKKKRIEIAKDLTNMIINNGIKVVIGMSIFSGVSSLGTLTLTIALLNQLSSFISTIVNSKRELDRARESFDILELYLQATEKKPSVHYDQVNFNSITIDNLSFSYPQFTDYELAYFDILLKQLNTNTSNNESELNQLHAIQEAKKKSLEQSPQILSNISLSFQQGKIYGIVGRNGAGKTTLMHLIMNYFHVPTDSIYRGTTGNHELSFDFFEKNIAVIEQSPFILWGFSIKNNILLGVEKTYSDEEIYTLLAMFDLEDKIRSMRKGLDTLYSYDCDLSGGQLQIISLLRVYLQDKPVIILDEGTNQLDATNEGKITNLLLSNKKDKIIIMISHRMTSLQKADYLYCLENGTITDEGAPQELKSRPSLFQQFWKEQVE